MKPWLCRTLTVLPALIVGSAAIVGAGWIPAAAKKPDPALARAAGTTGLDVVYLHTKQELPFDATLRDVAATTDVATARWVAKSMEYPVRTELSGAPLPWTLIALALLAAAVGIAATVGVIAVLRRRSSIRHFVQHVVEMVLAMVAGMMLLDPLWRGLFDGLAARPDLRVLLMALDMAVGMGLWMWIRGHGRRMIGEMSTVMVAPFVLCLVPFYLGVLSGDGLMALGHVGMVLGMVALMLVRFGHYGQPLGWRVPGRAQVQ